MDMFCEATTRDCMIRLPQRAAFFLHPSNQLCHPRQLCGARSTDPTLHYATDKRGKRLFPLLGEFIGGERKNRVSIGLTPHIPPLSQTRPGRAMTARTRTPTFCASKTFRETCGSTGAFWRSSMLGFVEGDENAGTPRGRPSLRIDRSFARTCVCCDRFTARAVRKSRLMLRLERP